MSRKAIQILKPIMRGGNIIGALPRKQMSSPTRPWAKFEGQRVAFLGKRESEFGIERLVSNTSRPGLSWFERRLPSLLLSTLILMSFPVPEESELWCQHAQGLQIEDRILTASDNLYHSRISSCNERTAYLEHPDRNTRSPRTHRGYLVRCQRVRISCTSSSIPPPLHAAGQL